MKGDGGGEQMTTIHPFVRDLITSLSLDSEYAITRNLVAHEIVRQGALIPSSPVVFYDKATGREAGLAFGGRDNYIRLNREDIRRAQAAIRDGGHSHHVGTNETLTALNAACAAIVQQHQNTEAGL